MIKKIYTTGQAIQNELNHLYQKEHDNFVNDYYGFIDSGDNDCIITIEKLQGFIEYLQEEVNDGNGGRKGIKLMFERVIQIMQHHSIDAVNLYDTNEGRVDLLDMDIKDIADYNARNVNHIEVKNYLCYLPERAKELINKHIEDDNCSNYYTEYTYDVGGKYFLTDALEDVESKFEDDDFENIKEKTFYTELKAVLEKITCDTIEY